MKNLYKIENELYIINSSEKIKENTQTFKEGLNGDWFYNTIYNFITRTGDITPYDFKIILTTNKLLIKDGIQAIDDEFLEWFIKNPTCESVEVEEVYPLNCCIKKEGKTKMNNGCMERNRCLNYKIIIPQEEPNKTHYLDELPNMDKNVLAKMWADAMPKLEPKQETLEEAAERFAMTKNWDFESSEGNGYYDYVEGFVEGYKLAQERMYSDEDLVQLLNFVSGKYNISNGIGWFHTHESNEDVTSKEVLDKWFKQFKKK